MIRSSARHVIVAVLALGLGLAGCASTPVPEPTATEPPLELGTPVTSAELAEYGGVAMIDLASRCTATLIETGADEASAYLLTNGHCVGLDGQPANRTVVDDEAFGEAVFFQTDDTAESDRLRVDAERVEYATMRGTDVAIVRLAATLGELRDAGAVPVPIADEPPQAATAVVNIAAPSQGLDEDEWMLRRGACTLGSTSDVIEYNWLWLDAQRNDCPGVIGGSSGSPLFADGEVVSIINTTNTGVAVERGDTCYLGKPCEVDGADAVFVAETSYGVRVAGLGRCFVDGVFTLAAPCPLEVTTLWDVAGGGIFGAEGIDGGGWTPELALRSERAVEVAVITDIALGEASRCTDPAAYADAVRVSLEADAEEPVVVPVTLPPENGFVLACAAVPGEEALAARFVFAIDTIAPTVGPAFAVQDLGDSIMVDPLFDIPDIADIEVLWGAESSTDCADRAAYDPYRRQSIFIDTSELPVRLCAVGFDMAGNESPVSERVLAK